MSVMWGLTGNMDPRLVSDGKALDVAYDAGEGNPKRVAEVTLTGEPVGGGAARHRVWSSSTRQSHLSWHA